MVIRISGEGVLLGMCVVRVSGEKVHREGTWCRKGVVVGRCVERAW